MAKTAEGVASIETADEPTTAQDAALIKTAVKPMAAQHAASIKTNMALATVTVEPTRNKKY